MTDFALRISPELHAELAAKAEEEGVSINQLVLCELARLVGKRSRKEDRISVEGFEQLFDQEP